MTSINHRKVAIILLVLLLFMVVVGFICIIMVGSQKSSIIGIEELLEVGYEELDEDMFDDPEEKFMIRAALEYYHRKDNQNVYISIPVITATLTMISVYDNDFAYVNMTRELISELAGNMIVKKVKRVCVDTPPCHPRQRGMCPEPTETIIIICDVEGDTPINCKCQDGYTKESDEYFYEIDFVKYKELLPGLIEKTLSPKVKDRVGVVERLIEDMEVVIETDLLGDYGPPPDMSRKCDHNDVLSEIVGYFYSPMPQSGQQFRLTSRYFSLRVRPGYSSFHCAVDINVGAGIPFNVYASEVGQVSHAGWHKCGGGIIYIIHMIGGIEYRTVYTHLTQFFVKEKETVSRGQLIGYAGDTIAKGDKCSTGIHLHFEIQKNISGEWVKLNPMTSLINPYNYNQCWPNYLFNCIRVPAQGREY